RLIALCGGGSNGKGTFIKLKYKFLGEGNYVSSEIKSLSEDRFEPAVLSFLDWIVSIPNSE
ncbi:unnamed protein product, partial [marine sediment metagenome]